jgi:molybdenum cofactor sulfurtransferase
VSGSIIRGGTGSLPAFTPDGLAAAERDFLAAFPDFDPAGTFPALRRREYDRLDDDGHVYLDYTGGGLHTAGQVDAHARLLRTHVLGNPHSDSPTSRASTDLVQRTRSLVCELFNAPADDYLCVFTANASAALKLVGESYPFEPGGTFALTFDKHNSVNGIRCFAGRRRVPGHSTRPGSVRTTTNRSCTEQRPPARDVPIRQPLR